MKITHAGTRSQRISPRKRKSDLVPTRSVPEMLLELAYQLHATRVVKRPAISAHACSNFEQR